MPLGSLGNQEAKEASRVYKGLHFPKGAKPAVSFEARRGINYYSCVPVEMNLNTGIPKSESSDPNSESKNPTK
jgi:hypothetical protein